MKLSTSAGRRLSMRWPSNCSVQPRIKVKANRPFTTVLSSEADVSPASSNMGIRKTIASKPSSQSSRRYQVIMTVMRMSAGVMLMPAMENSGIVRISNIEKMISGMPK